MESNIWLTTVDNEYDPFKQFDSWFKYDFANIYRKVYRSEEKVH